MAFIYPEFPCVIHKPTPTRMQAVAVLLSELPRHEAAKKIGAKTGQAVSMRLLRYRRRLGLEVKRRPKQGRCTYCDPATLDMIVLKRYREDYR
jgi:hypothetical protein